MAVNAATSSYVNNASSGKGFSGLASGVDTESMVEELLSGTQSKIDKQQGIKQQLEWKQSIYQNIISQINAFQSKFFSYSSSTNLASASFWNSLSVFANSKAFTATAGSTASTGATNISVRRLATKTTVSSGKAVSGDLTGKLNVNAFRDVAREQLKADYNVQFQVGSTTVDVDLKSVFVLDGEKGFTNYSTKELDAALQKKLQDSFNAATSGVTVTVTDGEVSITGTGISKNISVTGASGEMGLKRLGLSVGDSGKMNSEKTSGTITSTVDAVPTMEFTLTLDDVTKTVSVDMRKVIVNGSIGIDELKDELQKSVQRAHGSGQIKVEFDKDNNLTMKVYSSSGREDIGRKLDVGGSEEVLAVLGMRKGQSNRVSLSYTLGELNLSSPLRGDDYRFTINGVEFHFTSDTAVIDVMDIINRSSAGVRMSYRSQDDRFVLESKEFGAGKEIEMSQSEGNLLNAFFGGTFKVGTVAAKGLKDMENFEPAVTKGYTFKFPEEEENGEKKTKTAENTTLGELTVTVPGKGPTTLADLLGLDDDIKLSDLSSKSKYFYGTDNDGNITILQKLDANTTLKDMGYTLIGSDGVDYSGYALAGLERATGGKLVYKGGELILNGYWGRSADAETTRALDELFGKGAALGYEEGDTISSTSLNGIMPAILTKHGWPRKLKDGESLENIPLSGSGLKTYLGFEGAVGGKYLSDLAEITGGKYTASVVDGEIVITQKIDENTTLSELAFALTGEEGATFLGLDGDKTLADLPDLTEGKLSFDAKTGKIVLTGYYADSTDGLSAETVNTLNQLFGEGLAFGSSNTSDLDIVMGQNAEVEVDGVITERSSNNFTINGINFDVTDLTGSYEDPGLREELQADGSYKYYAYDEETGEYSIPVNPAEDRSLVLVDGKWMRFVGDPVNVTVKQDTDTVIAGLKEFIDEYNVLVKTLNDYLDEDTNYRDYPPLTSAQKAEMSEREIELWEEKAKEGLLHNDPTIQAFLQQMRTALYQKPEGCHYALYELGIETGEWEAKGQLSLVIGGEAQLKNLLENDPSGVASLFTGVNGLGTTLNDILKNTASTSSGSPGTLVQVAGTKGNDTNSSIYEQLKAIDDKIERLKQQYEAEKSRYWNQFNTMEQMISQMNTQSMYLAQMMGMGSY